MQYLKQSDDQNEPVSQAQRVAGATADASRNVRADISGADTTESVNVGLISHYTAVLPLETASRLRRLTITSRVTNGVLAVLCVILSFAVIYDRWLVHHHHPVKVSVLLYDATIYGGIAVQRWLSWRWVSAANKIAMQANVEDVGAFVEGIGLGGATTGASVILKDLLKRVGRDDGQYLNEKQRQILRRYIGRSRVYNPDTELVGLILRLFETIGDTKSLSTVERLADGKGCAKFSKNLRGTARKCANSLRERLDSEQVSNTLLRASTAMNEPQSTLLRPASQGVVDRSKELLRPTLLSPTDSKSS